MAMKKILAVTLAAVMALTLAACGGSKDEQTTSADTTAAAVVEDAATTQAAEEVTEAVSEAETETEAVSEDATEAASEQAAEQATEAATEEATEEENKTPKTAAEIVEFYKKAAAETDKSKPATSNKMALESLDGGSGGIGKFISMLEPIVKRALDKNSSTDDHITGGWENLTADDVASATATNDGKYTTLTINLKEQTDGFSGDSHAGHVGHGISVLGNVQNAIDELNGVDVDPSGGNISLRYTNGKISVKVDNATGKIVSGTWSYRCNVNIDNVKAKIAILPATLNGTTAVITQTITM